jgi:acetoacetyl-CoA synthetase
MNELADQPLWCPSPERAAATPLAAFIKGLSREAGYDGDDYAALHRFSIERPEAFWIA